MDVRRRLDAVAALYHVNACIYGPGSLDLTPLLLLLLLSSTFELRTKDTAFSD